MSKIAWFRSLVPKSYPFKSVLALTVFDNKMQLTMCLGWLKGHSLVKVIAVESKLGNSFAKCSKTDSKYWGCIRTSLAIKFSKHLIFFDTFKSFLASTTWKRNNQRLKTCNFQHANIYLKSSAKFLVNFTKLLQFVLHFCKIFHLRKIFDK